METYLYKAVNCKIKLQSLQFFEDKDSFQKNTFQKLPENITDLREQMGTEQIDIDKLLQNYNFQNKLLLLSEKKQFKKILIKLSLNQDCIFSVTKFDDFSYLVAPEKNTEKIKGKFLFGEQKQKLNLKEIDEKLEVFMLDKSTQQFYKNTKRTYLLERENQTFNAIFTVLDFDHQKNQQNYYIYLFPFIYNYSNRDITSIVEQQVTEKLESCRYLFMKWIPHVKKISFNKIQEHVHQVIPHFFFLNQVNKYLIVAEQEYHGKTEFVYVDDEFILEKLQLSKNKNARRLYNRKDLFDILVELQIENGKIVEDKIDEKTKQVLEQIEQFQKQESCESFNVLIRTDYGTSLQQYIHNKFEDCNILILTKNEKAQNFIKQYFSPIKDEKIKIIEEDSQEFYQKNELMFQFVFYENLETLQQELQDLQKHTIQSTQVFVKKTSQQHIKTDKLILRKQLEDFWVFSVHVEQNNQFKQIKLI